MSDRSDRGHEIDADDAALTFRDDAARTTIAGECALPRGGDDVPLKALTQHLFLESPAGTSSASGRCRSTAASASHGDSR